MEQFLLLAMLAVGTHGFSAWFPVPETKCDFTHNTSLPCAPVVGGTVFIRLKANITGYQLNCFKNQEKLFSFKKNKLTSMAAYVNRTEFLISNGTLKFTSVEKSDSGQYRVEVFDSDGKHAQDIKFNLEVKENIYPIVILVCVGLGALLIVLLCCCVCCKVKRRRKSGKRQVKDTKELSSLD
ncbi:uncharacterized protein [Nothobranchius furzeri]|uniref:Junctional adhesion molecule 2b n=1 Tax=Nothobranchius furzeri TaxID=105023 RepID=A0A1A8AU55_NOTFU|nr:uncharacterized protein LOC107375631 [Nothobranchius furzeri]KAF7228094.1 putative LOC107375631-like protein [Nothobranchius furzeri]